MFVGFASGVDDMQDQWRGFSNKGGRRGCKTHRKIFLKPGIFHHSRRSFLSLASFTTLKSLLHILSLLLENYLFCPQNK